MVTLQQIREKVAEELLDRATDPRHDYKYPPGYIAAIRLNVEKVEDYERTRELVIRVCQEHRLTPHQIDHVLFAMFK